MIAAIAAVVLMVSGLGFYRYLTFVPRGQAAAGEVARVVQQLAVDPASVIAKDPEGLVEDGYFVEAPRGTKFVIVQRPLYFWDDRTVLVTLQLTRPGESAAEYVAKVRYRWPNWKVLAVTPSIS